MTSLSNSFTKKTSPLGEEVKSLYNSFLVTNSAKDIRTSPQLLIKGDSGEKKGGSFILSMGRGGPGSGGKGSTSTSSGSSENLNDIITTSSSGLGGSGKKKRGSIGQVASNLSNSGKSSAASLGSSTPSTLSNSGKLSNLSNSGKFGLSAPSNLSNSGKGNNNTTTTATTTSSLSNSGKAAAKSNSSSQKAELDKRFSLLRTFHEDNVDILKLTQKYQFHFNEASKIRLQLGRALAKLSQSAKLIKENDENSSSYACNKRHNKGELMIDDYCKGLQLLGEQISSIATLEQTMSASLNNLVTTLKEQNGHEKNELATMDRETNTANKLYTSQIRRLSFSGSKSSKKGNDLNHNSEGDLTLARQVQDVESKRFDMINELRHKTDGIMLRSLTSWCVLLTTENEFHKSTSQSLSTSTPFLLSLTLLPSSTTSLPAAATSFNSWRSDLLPSKKHTNHPLPAKIDYKNKILELAKDLSSDEEDDDLGIEGNTGLGITVGGSLKVVGVWDYDGEGPEELSFRKGDVLLNVVKDTAGWWEGESNGKRGFFPINYVKEVGVGRG